MVRKDVYGKTLADGKRITGHGMLDRALLIQHFQGEVNIGVHLISPENLCRCLIADIDAHDDSADSTENWQCVNLIVDALSQFGLPPLVCDSNGKGGYHVRTHFKKPVASQVVHWLAQNIRKRLKSAGLPDVEIFPKQGDVTIQAPYGSWVRLPGRHHKRDHYTRIWDGERWLEDAAAVKAIVRVAGEDATKLQAAFNAQETKLEPRIIRTPRRNADERPDTARVGEALEFCKDFDVYDTWIGIGMALNDWDQSQGLDLWRQWSEQSPKYKAGDCEPKWPTFSPGGPLTIRTLFKQALDGGWDPSRAGGKHTSHPGGPLPGGNGTYAPASLVGITEEPWPDLCLQEPPPGADFPVDVLPVALQRFCQGVADVTLTPPDMAGSAMLATASAAIGQSISIQLRKTWRESALLYLLVVAPPGSTKTPTLKMVVNPLTKIDIRLRRESKESRPYWESQKKDLKKGEVAPEEPPQFRAIVKDITRETLAAILRDNPRGVLADPDEATAWVSSFNEYKAKGSDRQFWLSIWSSSSVSVDREGGRRSIFVKAPLVTVFGSLTPDMCGSLSEEHGRNDGFLDRILFAYPEVFPDQFWTEKELDDGDKFIWEGIIRELHGVAMIRTPEDELESHVIKFTEEAKAAYITWYNKHVLETKTDNMPAKCQGVWSKFKGYSGRLILIISRMRVAIDQERDLRTEPVTLADVQGGIRLVEYFKTQYLRIESEMTGGTGSPEALVVLRWIQRNRRTEFRVADIKSSLRRRFKTIASLHAPIRLLVEANAIRLRKESTDEPAKSGPKPTATYEVNPKVLEEP